MAVERGLGEQVSDTLGDTQSEPSTILVNNYWISIIKLKEKPTQLNKTLHFPDNYLRQTVLGPLHHFLSIAHNLIHPDYRHKTIIYMSFVRNSVLLKSANF